MVRIKLTFQGFPGGLVVRNPATVQETQVPTLGQKIPWRRNWPSTPVFLPGEFHARGAWWATVREGSKSQT